MIQKGKKRKNVDMQGSDTQPKKKSTKNSNTTQKQKKTKRKSTRKTTTDQLSDDVGDSIVYYKEAAAKIKSATSWRKLKEVVSKLHLPALDPPVENLTLEEAYLEQDEGSLELMPPEVDGHIPCEIWPDGNCLAACMSLLQFGYQTRQEEMRVRLVCELVINFDKYLDDDYMQRGFEGGGPFYLQNLSMYCEDGDTSEDRLQKHIYLSRYDGQYLGVFHIAAAATVINRVLYSVYPTYAGHIVRRDINRKFLPREPSRSCSEPGYIMWSNTTGKQLPETLWKPNHFVLLLKPHR